ncbi:MAG: nucleotidyltransferase domain-containing protein [Oscillospiraceae bacterium]|nr:nucleotidyltransferase domain-containing protein [Oscillospiraceae bacterium]
MSRVYTVSELRDTLHPVFLQHGVRSAVLFGSYSKGQATERSDVDLLVDSGLRGLAYFGLLESVVSALDVPVDMIDVTQLERGSLIDREIRKSGVQIYGQ